MTGKSGLRNRHIIVSVGWGIFENPKSYYFSVSSSRITQLHMIEPSSFQGNILVTDPMKRDKNMLLSGESGAK